MKYSKDSLDKVLARVRQERISVQHGSPSDVEIAQAQLADMAADYIPGLIEAVCELACDLEHYNKVLAHAAAQGQQFTHAQVADKVRMLTRSDLDHELVCVLARDRIIVLAKENAEQAARLSQVEAARDELAEQLRPGSPTERAPTTWAYEQVCAALENHKGQLSSLRGAVTSLLEDLANGCVPVKMERGKETTPYWLGVNSERAKLLAYAELKCKELGIEWPIKAIPYSSNLPAEPSGPALLVAEAAPAAELLDQLPGCPAAKCHGCGLPSHAARCRVVDCPAKAPDWFSPLVFDSAAEYDASVASGVGRIESGEVKPIEQKGGDSE